MSALKNLLTRAEKWPADAQADLLQAALVIERNQEQGSELTEEDWKIIDARIAGAARGEIATDAEMEALFGKYRVS
jgi:hypothetical protein